MKRPPDLPSPSPYCEPVGHPEGCDLVCPDPVARQALLSSLVKWLQWVMYEPLQAQEHLDALGRVAAQARCYDLTLGPDLFGNPDLLLELTR